MAGSPWSNQVVSLLILTEQTGTFSGLFGYSPTAGAGNLILSVSATSGTDPYGNAYPDGVCSFQGSAQANLHVNPTQSVPAVDMPTNVTSEHLHASLYTLVANKGLVNEQLNMRLQGPASTNDSNSASVALTSAAKDGSIETSGILLFNSSFRLYWDSAGVHIVSTVYGANSVLTLGDPPLVPDVGLPSTPASGCILFYNSGKLWALGPSGNAIAIATT